MIASYRSTYRKTFWRARETTKIQLYNTMGKEHDRRRTSTGATALRETVWETGRVLALVSQSILLFPGFLSRIPTALHLFRPTHMGFVAFSSFSWSPYFMLFLFRHWYLKCLCISEFYVSLS